MTRYIVELPEHITASFVRTQIEARRTSDNTKIKGTDISIVEAAGELVGWNPAMIKDRCPKSFVAHGVVSNERPRRQDDEVLIQQLRNSGCKCRFDWQM